MILASMICMATATLIIAICLCFQQNKKALCLFLQIFFFASVILMGIAFASFKNNFSGYSITLILSVIPMFLTCFNLEKLLSQKRDNKTAQLAIEKHNSNLMSCLALALCSACIGFCGLYIGKESILGFLIGVATGFAALFFFLARKNTNILSILSYFCGFFAIGTCSAQIFAVLIYAQNIGNILYAIGSAFFAIYAFNAMFFKKKYSHFFYLLSIIPLFLSMIL